MIAVVLAGFATLGAAGVQEAAPPLPPAVRLGDDVCAVSLSVRCDVSDERGRPVVDAELTGLHQWMKVEPDWHSIGVTNAKGRVEGNLCLQSTSVYLSNPPKGQLALTFRVTKPGHSPVELRQPVDSEEVLRAGLLVQKREDYVVPDVAAMRSKASFKVRLRVRLKD